MKELIRLDDALTKYEWSSDLREYVVPVRVLKHLPRIDEPEEPAEDQSDMLRAKNGRITAYEIDGTAKAIMCAVTKLVTQRKGGFDICQNL